MDKQDYIKSIEKNGPGALQKVPFEFFDDENFISDAILANEVYAKSKMDAEEQNDLKDFVRRVARIRFEDVLEVRKEGRKEFWKDEIRNNFLKIKELPFDLACDEKFLKELKENNESDLDLAEKIGELQKFGKIDDVKKEARKNFDLAILRRKQDRKNAWEERIAKDKNAIAYLPFDLVFDGDFRKKVSARFASDEIQNLDKLFGNRIKAAKIIEDLKEQRNFKFSKK